MSLLDIEYQNKINELEKYNSIDFNFLNKSLKFKNILDNFKLINTIDDSFFIELYKKNFSDILEFETSNNFNYSTESIIHIEQKIQNLSFKNNIKYDKILDYMLLKSVDIKNDYYGSIINFIYILFNDIRNNLEIIKKIKKIWKDDYSIQYPRFSDFQKSNDFEVITTSLLNEEEDESNEISSAYEDKKNFYEFLIFTSEQSDFFMDEIIGQNLDSFLFENKKEVYKKNGNNMLLEIKNKIISYN
jgi:hypothetical protein